MTTSPLTEAPRTGFDTAAAVTRSLLGWGVVAGPFYVTVGIVLAATRPGFDLTRHPLSVLMLGDQGWMQRTNLVLSAGMVLAASYGMLRTVRNGRGLAMATLTGGTAPAWCSAQSSRPTRYPASPPGPRAAPSRPAECCTCCSVRSVSSHWQAPRSATPDGAAAAVTPPGAGLRRVAARSCSPASSAAQHWPSPSPALHYCGLAVLAGWLWLAASAAHLYTVVPHPVLALRTDRAT